MSNISVWEGKDTVMKKLDCRRKMETSKGSEYTFAAALAYPEISCVVVKTPSWYYSEGLSGGQPSGECCWSQNTHINILPLSI